MRDKIRAFFNSLLGATLTNLFFAFFLLFIARVVFLIYNYSTFSDYLSWSLVFSIFKGGAVFDFSALFYINALYVVMMLFPFHLKEKKTYHKVTKWIFVVINSLALLMNLCDTVYFRFTGRRTTTTVFSEFKNENNLGGIFWNELWHNALLVLIFAALVFALIKVYRMPKFRSKIKLVPYYLINFIALLVIAPCAVLLIRGGIGRTTRPITISNANQYVNRPIEAAIVLNTPFSMIRTIGKNAFEDPKYFNKSFNVEKYFTPVHYPTPEKQFQKKNVVIFILESFGRGFWGSLNKGIEGGKYKGYTPFLDSLVQHSLAFKNGYANGTKSIDGMPAVLCGIPMFVEPFVLTPASLNKVDGLPRYLAGKGYYSAFFHGAPNGSMGFQALAKTIGFDDYFGMDEYCDDKNYNGRSDFDGAWAIWDDKFFQFYNEKINTFKQPFVTALFSATSHHPYNIPDSYKNIYKEDRQPIDKCIRYSDESLRLFFEKAKKEPWYKNTLFVITSDHSRPSLLDDYASDQQFFAAPIVFYAPGDPSLQGMRDDLAQQIDILPSILTYLGYDKPYFSFGTDLVGSKRNTPFTVNYLTGMYQYAKGSYFLQFDGHHTVGIYNYKKDHLLKNNLIKTAPKDTIKQMEFELKVIIQDYMNRMNQDRLTVTKKK